MFNMMDFLNIGMVDYEKFENFLRIEAPVIDLINHKEKKQSDFEAPQLDDDFSWQESIIKQI